MAKIILNERDEALAIHYILLTGQLAGLARSLEGIFRLATRKDEDNKLFKAYRAYIKTELADAITHIKKMCQLLDLSFEEIVQLSIIRDKEKREEFLKKYPHEHWL